MRKQHHIRLTPDQRAEAQAVLARGTASALTHRRARILLEAEDRPGRRVRSDRQVTERCAVSARTVARVGAAPGCGWWRWPAAPRRRARRAGACVCWRRGWWNGRRCPPSAANWCAPRSKKPVKPWRVRRWLIPPTANAAFVVRMENVLTVYARPLDPARPVVCFDESGKDLKAHTRPPRGAAPGRLARQDSEFAREGSRNLFLRYAPWLGRRQNTVTERRTAVDFAQAIRDLVDTQYPEADQIVLVLDNRNPHTPAALYEAFAPAEAWRLLHKLAWHYTPTHGSWLNMAELEWSVLSRQCLDRRIPDVATLETAIAAWVADRNTAAVTASWHFTKEDARQRSHWLYPHPE